MDNLNFDNTVRENENGLLEFAFGNSLTGGFPGVTVSDRETALRRGTFVSFTPNVYVGSSVTPESGWLFQDGLFMRVGGMAYGVIGLRKNGVFTGTGELSFSVPFLPYVGLNTQSGFPVNGRAQGTDASSGSFELFHLGGDVATVSVGATMRLFRSDGSAVTHNSPWSWTTNDQISITFAYRV